MGYRLKSVYSGIYSFSESDSSLTLHSFSALFLLVTGQVRGRIKVEIFTVLL